MNSAEALSFAIEHIASDGLCTCDEREDALDTLEALRDLMSRPANEVEATLAFRGAALARDFKRRSRA